MRQTFDEHTSPDFGPRHVPLIRAAMAQQGLDGFLVPHEDEHQNEYLPEANDRLAWATGFTGSAGAAVILKDKAAVFVDGRYTLQVRDQVDQALFEIRDLVEGGVPAYLVRGIESRRTIGLDRFIYGLGVRDIGETTSTVLARNFADFPELEAAATRAAQQLPGATYLELAEAKGLGPKALDLLLAAQGF